MPGKSSRSDDGEQTERTTDATTNGVATSNFKMKGETGDNTAAGVLGNNTSSSDTPVGIEGNAPNASNGRGVVGTSLSDPNNYDDFAAPAEGYGVYGVSDRLYGVFAYKPGGSGPALFARSDTSSLSIRTFQNGSGPAIESQDVEVTGQVDASQGYTGNVGSSAYLSSTASIDGTLSKIPFDATVADQRNEFDTGNNWFECAYDGAYEVKFGIESASIYGSGSTVRATVSLEIEQGNASSNPAGSQGITYDFTIPGSGDGDGVFARTYSKTVYGLLAGNRISVEMSQNSGSSKNLQSGQNETFFEARQVA